MLTSVSAGSGSPGVERSWTTYLLARIREWQRKSHDDADPFNRYVSLFVAYNTLYNLFAAMRHPGEDLSRRDAEFAVDAADLISNPNQLIQQLQPGLDEYAHSIPVFQEEYYAENGRRIPISDALREALERRQGFRALQLILRWFYKVRCNLVHGGKDYDNEDQRRLLERSSPLLDKILSSMILEYSNRAGIQERH